jgi:hypothetical protein
MTFDVSRLNKIVMEVAHQFRKGDAVIHEEKPGLLVTHVYMMPHVSEATPGLEMVDMWFINVGVDKDKAEAHRDELVAILNEWPVKSGAQPLDGGLSYISIGATVGSQDLALMFMAVGKILGFWKVITPEILGMKAGDPKGEELAGLGFVMASGYNPERVAA